MTTRRGIIAPVTPFASRADRSSVSSVMGAIVAAHLVTCQRMTVFMTKHVVARRGMNIGDRTLHQV